MGASAFHRLRRAEFLAALASDLPRQLGARSRTGSITGVAAIVTLVLVLGAGLRCLPLHWRDQSSAFALSVGLLWSLGGALPMLAAVTAGWAWQSSRSPGRTRPLLHLLPLSSGQVARAKLQGRLAAVLLVCAVGCGLGLVARGLMSSSGLVQPPPPMLDPWLPGSLLMFAACFVLTWRLDWAMRREAPACLTALAAMLLIFAVPYWGLPLLRYGAWSAVVAPAGLLGLVLLLALAGWSEDRLRRRRDRHLVVSQAKPPAAPPEVPQAGLPDLASQPLTPGWRWLRPAVIGAARTALIILAVSLLLEGLLALAEACLGYYETGHWGLVSPAARALVALPTLPIWLTLATLLPLPAAAWSESFVGGSTTRSAPTEPGRLAHLGYLLPIAARTLWRRHFIWTLAKLTQRAVPGLIAFWLLAVLNRPLGLVEDLGLAQQAPAALAAVVSLVCGGFALLPLLRRMNAVLGRVPVWPGLLLAGVTVVIVAALPVAHAMHLRSLLTPAPVAAAALLAISWALTEPRAWPLRPDGRLSSRSVWQASAVAVVLLPLAGALFAAGFGLLHYLRAL